VEVIDAGTTMPHNASVFLTTAATLIGGIRRVLGVEDACTVTPRRGALLPGPPWALGAVSVTKAVGSPVGVRLVLSLSSGSGRVPRSPPYWRRRAASASWTGPRGCHRLPATPSHTLNGLPRRLVAVLRGRHAPRTSVPSGGAQGPQPLGTAAPARGIPCPPRRPRRLPPLTESHLGEPAARDSPMMASHRPPGPARAGSSSFLRSDAPHGVQDSRTTFPPRHSRRDSQIPDVFSHHTRRGESSTNRAGFTCTPKNSKAHRPKESCSARGFTGRCPPTCRMPLIATTPMGMIMHSGR
jgi:hypothetical protein